MMMMIWKQIFSYKFEEMLNLIAFVVLAYEA